MRADVKRFAAHKAHYVHRKLQEIDKDTTIPDDQKEAYKGQAMRTFHRWGEAEYNYAVQSTQMAEQWENFAKDGDRYYLQYRTAADEKVRAEHAILHNTTLPIDDPFWQQFMPPNGWNCRCTVVQVRKDKYAQTDSTTACQAGEAATSKQPSFRFNPGATKTCFPDNVSYYKHAGRNRAERERTEKACEIMAQKAYREVLAKKYVGTEIECLLGTENQVLQIKTLHLKHFMQGLYGCKSTFWIKQEMLLSDIRSLFIETKYIGKKACDANHNTNADTRRLKQATDYFFYYRKELPNGNSVYLHIGRYRATGKMYLYDISEYNPIKE